VKEILKNGTAAAWRCTPCQRKTEVITIEDSDEEPEIVTKVVSPAPPLMAKQTVPPSSVATSSVPTANPHPTRFAATTSPSARPTDSANSVSTPRPQATAIDDLPDYDSDEEMSTNQPTLASVARADIRQHGHTLSAAPPAAEQDNLPDYNSDEELYMNETPRAATTESSTPAPDTEPQNQTPTPNMSSEPPDEPIDVESVTKSLTPEAEPLADYDSDVDLYANEPYHQVQPVQPLTPTPQPSAFGSEPSTPNTIRASNSVERNDEQLMSIDDRESRSLFLDWAADQFRARYRKDVRRQPRDTTNLKSQRFDVSWDMSSERLQLAHNHSVFTSPIV
jgi:hypothetical protein